MRSTITVVKLCYNFDILILIVIAVITIAIQFLKKTDKGGEVYYQLITIVTFV